MVTLCISIAIVTVALTQKPKVFRAFIMWLAVIILYLRFKRSYHYGRRQLDIDLD
jgi:hypothetical protein